MRIARLFSSTLLGALLLTACAERAAAPPWTEDESAIRAALQESAEAWNRGDLRGHLASYDDSVTFMTRDGPRPGIAPIEEAFAAKYFHEGRPKQMLRFEQLSVRRLDRDAALAVGRFVLSGGDEPEQSGWFSTVWLRTDGGWRTVHDHSS